MKGVLRLLSRPGIVAAMAVLFVLGILASGYWMGAAGPQSAT